MTILSRSALRLHAASCVALNMLLVAAWSLTTRASFWPIHAFLPLAALLALHGWVVLVKRRPALRARLGGNRALAVHVGASTVQWLYLVALWVEGGRGYFWPAWPLLGLGLLAGIHTVTVFRPFPEP